MVDHELSEAQELLRRTAAEFLGREYPLERVRQIYASEPRYDPNLWRAIVELGWTGAPFAEVLGGSGGTAEDAGLILEELGKAACATPYGHSTVAAGLALVGHLPEIASTIASGESLVIPVVGRSAGDGVTVGEPVSGADGELRCSGVLPYVPWAELATHLLFPLRVKGTSAMALVATGQTGVSGERLDVSGGDPLYCMTLDGAQGRLVASEGLAEQVQLLGAMANALLLAGLAQGALDLAVSYAKDRVQFGRPIGAFQALQHKMADMAIEVEVGRNLARKAAWLQARNEPFALAARYAKAYLGDVAGRVSRQALQIHGGVGFIDNHPAQFFYTIGNAAAAQYGTSREHRAAITAEVLGERRLREETYGLRVH